MVRTSSRARGLMVAVMMGGALAVAPVPASAQYSVPEERPSTGTGQIIVGWIATGSGLAALAVLPVCFMDFYPDNGKDICVGGQIAIGAVGLGIGIPFLAVGYSNRSEYREWRERNALAAHLSRVRFTATSDAGFLTYRGEL